MLVHRCSLCMHQFLFHVYVTIWTLVAVLLLLLLVELLTSYQGVEWNALDHK